MCGIIAYKGPMNGTEIVLNGLKTLEYRGYDSWGIVCKREIGSNNFCSIKKIGKIGSVSLSDLKLCACNVAMGHTRWATHGGVNKKNAHPQFSENGNIVVVHNGIVENFQTIKNSLIKNGIKFCSDTDTEVIAQYISYLIESESMDYKTAAIKTLKKIEGSYAVVIMNNSDPKIYASRRGSPLVFGLGNENEYFLASDVPAFLEHTKKVIYLDDDELVEINDSGYLIESINTKEMLKKPISEITWSIEEAKKGKFPHFMLKELNEQRITIKNAIEQDPLNFENCVDSIKNAKGIFFVGCGTSYHACVSTSYIFSHVAKKHVNVVIASEFRNYEEFLGPDTLMIAVSQSGETADLLDAVKTAKKKGVKIMSIVNVVGSTLARMSDYNIMMNAGPEICVLSTKSYTSQLAILLMLCFGAAKKIEHGKSLIENVINQVPNLIDDNDEELKILAKRIKKSKDMFLIGRDLAFPTALEGALKIKEVSYIHAEGFPGGELKHGTIALIEEGVPVIVFVTDATRNLILSNAMEIKARGGYIIGVDSKNNDLFDSFIKVDEFSHADPIAMIIPIQLLSYYLALERGCDPDKPRNLAKSVTVK